MTTGKALNGKPYAGNPHVRFDEGEVAPAATPRRGSLLYKTLDEIKQMIAAGDTAQADEAHKPLSCEKQWFCLRERLANVIAACLAIGTISMTWGAEEKEDYRGLGEPTTWTVVGKLVESERIGLSRRHVICTNAFEITEGLPDSEAESRIVVEVDQWKETRDDCKRGEELVEHVLPQVQSGLDAFVPKWIADGKPLAGRPWRSLERWSVRRHELDTRIASAKFCNCLNLTLALLLHDRTLLKACQGVPLESLVRRLRFPEPRHEQLDGKKVFEKWASERLGDRLTLSEKAILFRWQFHVVDHERRPWMKLALAIENMAESAEKRRFRVDGDGSWIDTRPKESVARYFADFDLGDRSASDFVEIWHGKAVAAGMAIDEDGENLLAKARAGKTPWAGSVGISISDEFHQKKFKIHGNVPLTELQSARDVIFGGLGVDKNTSIALEFDEPDGATLKNAFEVFPADAIREFLLRGDGKVEMDVTGLAKCAHLRSVTLRDCKIKEGFTLSRCTELSRIMAHECDLGGLEFLSGCAALTEVKMENCSFTNLKSLWAADRLIELSVPNSKNVVDLSVVRKLGRLLSLDITGCHVDNFVALRGHPRLRTLKMEHLKGGVESLSCLMNNPELRTIDYSKAELPPSAYLEFARARRIRYYGDNLEGMLKEAVDDRDIQEIRRLCELDITTDVALSAFDFNDESDIAIFHVLVPKATKEALTRCLGKYIVLLGYGHSSKKPSYVPTNRVEIVKWLLKSGAETSDAISGMAHPAEKDKEIFRLMLPTASQKVKTKLLQKNVKSFGDRDDWDRRVRQAADRLEIVRLLLESGADPNAKNFFDKTPLGNAVEYDGDLWLVKLLLDKGADPKLLYPDMEIFRGFYQGHGDNVWGTNRYELVELLLAHGFDVNARGRFERTPIGEVVVFGGGFGEPYDLKMAKLLLEHGADPNAKQGENLGSAIDMAYGKYNAKELIDLLAKYGGVVSEEAKQKKKERQNRQGEHPAEGHSSRRQGIPNGQSDRIHEEMNRFHEELRKCTNPEEHRKLFEEHSRRMREIRESSNREEMRMQRCKEEAE